MRRDKAPNWDFFKERLADPTLLKKSVAILCDGYLVDLAVPIGGTRRGGYIALDRLRWCREAIKQLSTKPGFPNLRIRKYRGSMYNVCWGDPEPGTDDHAERGRYFGYSEAAIQKALDLWNQSP